MNTMLKSSAIAATMAMLFSLPCGNANAGAGVCMQEYRACIAAGYPEFDCENGYCYCLYGYIPVKSAALAVASGRRD
jgi:hypothetical protein